MKYIVDTSVWSLALRRKKRQETEETHKLTILLTEGERIFLPGIILQEILQGIRKQEQFKEVCESLSFLPFLKATHDDYIFASDIFNTCRSKGIQAGSIDCLIAALAIRNDCSLLTSDKDFMYIAKYHELKLA
jgi:predicted nucleic acid-binding protein